MSKKETALVPIQTTYPALVGDTDIAAMISENLQGEELSPWDLVSVKVPSGGAVSWEVETLSGTESVKELEAVIVHQQLVRTYWVESFEDSGGGSPPDCLSTDCVTGIGEPGGDCHSCPMAAWGSAIKGDGQACRQVRQLYVLLPGDLLPTLIPVPPSSLKTAKKYLLALAGKGVRYSDVVTKLSLTKDKNDAGIVLSRIVFAAGGLVPEDLREKVRAYGELIEQSLGANRQEVA